MRRRPGEHLSSSFSLAVRPAGQRDARPAHAQRPRVGLPIRRIVQGGQDMVEQVFDTEVNAGEIAVGFGRKISATTARRVS